MQFNQFNRLILTNESIFKSPNSYINAVLKRFLQFSLTLIPPNIYFKTFLSKTAGRLALPLFSVNNSAPYIGTGFINGW